MMLHGRRLRRARRRPESEDWTTHAIVVVGIIVSLGLIVISAILNFRMGYRSADTELDGWVYGLGAGLGDGLKAISPFMLAWGIKNRDWLAATSAALVFAILSLYSFTAALGFAADHRANKTAIAQGDIERHGDVTRAKLRAESRLEQLGTQRTPTEVRNAITTLYRRPVGKGGRTVGSASAECTLNRASTRETCAEVALLGEELARADEAQQLAETLERLRGELAEPRTKGIQHSADPQVDALARVLELMTIALGKDDIGAGLSILLALFVELGSGLGLYISTTPWRTALREDFMAGAVTRKEAGAGRAGDERIIGDVASYAYERLEPAPGMDVAMADIFADYRLWCRWRGDVPFNRREFTKQWGRLAREAGMHSVYRDRAEIYRDVKIVGP